MYDFSTDWLSESKKYWDTIFLDPKIVSVLEIGSFEGRSACYVIEKLKGRVDAHLTCIDPWVDYSELSNLMGAVEEKFDKNTKLALKKSDVEFRKLKGPSLKMLAKLVQDDTEKFDLIYIDGAHDSESVLTDAVLSMPLLKRGGILIFDDFAYNHPEQAKKPHEHAHCAVEAFLWAVGNQFTPIVFKQSSPDSAHSFKIIDGVRDTYQCYLKKL